MPEDPEVEKYHLNMPKMSVHTGLLHRKPWNFLYGQLYKSKKILNTNNKQCHQKWADKSYRAYEKTLCHLCQQRLGNYRKQVNWKKYNLIKYDYHYIAVRWRGREENHIGNKEHYGKQMWKK